ncbi:carbon-nitrogen hydrolase [Pseudomonas sp.]|uniref:carbon-nitrogen hydrolase n=1 Tax=Pseudomonas sp. TaxID=306 RepID=UPI002353FA71|nr:carbon-nitrogen hydrolase [Pseudomonas sp.]
MRVYLKLLVLLLLALTGLALYLNWTGDRRSGPLLSDLRTLPIHSVGVPGDHGNLLGIETRLQPADYQSPQRLRLKFATYLDQARDAGLLNPRTIVVLPEHVGTGLFALGEKPEVQQARTLRDAMQWTALSNPGRYLRALTGNRQRDDRRTEAVLLLKAKRMAEAYQAIFGELAAHYGVTLVAGSIVLPEPRLEQGRLRVGEGPLRQISLTFDRSGQPIGPLQYKRALGRYERRYSAAPDHIQRQTLATPAGPLAVLIGCDAYHEASPADAVLLAVPGARDDWAEACPEAPGIAADQHTYMAVRTLGVPWNLLGSPRKPARNLHGTPVQLTNLWLQR